MAVDERGRLTPGAFGIGDGDGVPGRRVLQHTVERAGLPQSHEHRDGGREHADDGRIEAKMLAQRARQPQRQLEVVDHAHAAGEAHQASHEKDRQHVTVAESLKELL